MSNQQSKVSRYTAQTGVILGHDVSHTRQVWFDAWWLSHHTGVIRGHDDSHTRQVLFWDMILGNVHVLSSTLATWYWQIYNKMSEPDDKYFSVWGRIHRLIGRYSGEFSAFAPVLEKCCSLLYVMSLCWGHNQRIRTG